MANEPCATCQGSGIRPLTEDEMEQQLESCDPEDAITTTYCECATGQGAKKSFWDEWGPRVEAELRSIGGGRDGN